MLVDNMAASYGGKCDAYCAGLGRRCVGAWEEDADTCTVLSVGDCTVRCDLARLKSRPGDTRARDDHVQQFDGTVQ